ncbi:hypothetical protein RvY_07873-2 [Ramazzottius varieornatus]|uniref:Uncharacterized protein n=1 Tax=Ramazzottius varieornatus TaxID=947166 RepID=A0A1D1VC17_RAMVA|nr:hypothetical protein RvY_07873-2 [Ramazzottius varieornatus]
MGYGYDPEEVCRFPHPNRSSTDISAHAQWMFLQCPPWSVDFRTPAFCCGTEDEKLCCDWSTYVMNRLGGGRTGVGMGIFVGLLFVSKSPYDGK